MRSALAQGRVRIEEIWAGETRLYMKVTLPAATVAERNTLIDEIQAHPLVEQVILSQAAPSVLRDVHQLQKYGRRAAIPDARLRGFRDKRRDYKPDLTAPHTGEIIVKYLEAETDTSARLAQARSRVDELHRRVGGRVVKNLRSESGEAELVALPPGADMATALETYLGSEDVEYAQPNYVCQIAQVPNDPEYPLLWAMPKISAPAAWDIRTDANSVIVAVVDTGIN